MPPFLQFLLYLLAIGDVSKDSTSRYKFTILKVGVKISSHMDCFSIPRHKDRFNIVKSLAPLKSFEDSHAILYMVFVDNVRELHLFCFLF
ncbi:hypothetical protein ES703_67615 [subsurface metagenome]